MIKAHHTFIVAIDPGASTGVAILKRKDASVLFWCTKDFFTVMDFLANSFENRTEVKVFVEVSPGVHIGHKEDLREETRDKMLINTGGVQREAQLLAEALRRAGYDVDEVPPVRGKKWDAERFRLFTKSHRRANNHERDAVRLADYYLKKKT